MAKKFSDYSYKKYQINYNLDKTMDKKIVEFIEQNGGREFIKDLILNTMLGVGVKIDAPIPVQEEKKDEPKEELSDDVMSMIEDDMGAGW